MNRILLGLVAIAVAASLTLPNSGCSKTKTVTDTVTVKDTTIVRDTLKVPYDTTYRHINDSLWAYYPLNGNLGDSSGNNHALTLFSGAALGIDMWGNPQSALDFPGGTARGLIADGGNFTAPSWSVSFLGMYRTTHIGFFFTKINYTDATGYSMAIGTDPVAIPDTIRIVLSGNTPANTCTNVGSVTSYILLDSTGPKLQTDAWYHVVATFSAGVLKMYINGVLVSQQTEPITQLAYCSNAGFNLGNWWSQDNGPALNGKIDELRIYTRAISATEVSYLYNKIPKF
ncbi:LamG domain-containing protein [Dinghuibacter silviterrae]|uniref:Concanavalin A-like lectin/glucanase superfamily protein n=1 Tax=Dinghuibacter silviterrae TaxID=1539049 RepID=A0A4R8DGP8_9BACT|nr:LamG domain-containing protein [Dinghuibacter silviterrae]TDW96637.1 concanavalin A-like lectin/glucanase superfamily protein [Dinghuibacter silviterrae]